MSTPNPDTIASLRRQNERLEGRLMVLEAKLDGQAGVIRQHLYDVVDADLRIKQAMAILRGDE
jgi:hypothetical protein